MCLAWRLEVTANRTKGAADIWWYLIFSSPGQPGLPIYKAKLEMKRFLNQKQNCFLYDLLLYILYNKCDHNKPRNKLGRTKLNKNSAFNKFKRKWLYIYQIEHFQNKFYTIIFVCLHTEPWMRFLWIKWPKYQILNS